MAVGFKGLPILYPVSGIRLGTNAAGIRKKNRPDLVVVECAAGTQVAAVFTQNKFCAAPVLVARKHISEEKPRALLINTGFANAGTGELGYQDAQDCCHALANVMKIKPEEVLPFSTGVIGERLPVERVIAGLPGCIEKLDKNGWENAAHGIMTTDTVPKASSRQIHLMDKTITLTGIAKGAGMIRPNMATLLAFVASDVAISEKALEACLKRAADLSFNRITVDGDTSTNDACLLMATGSAGNSVITDISGKDYKIFEQAVIEVLTDLAQAIVRDAEGATKFITIEVQQGNSEEECLAVAYTIAHSPLVKTAFFASDPNWGRILAAIGRAPIKNINVSATSIYLNDLCIVKNGARSPDYTEAQGQAVMSQEEILMCVQLGVGNESARLWTCDLSHEYVRINAEYRT